MWNHKSSKEILYSLFMILALALPHASVSATPDSRQATISLTSLIEAQGNALYAMNKLGYIPVGTTLSWSGYYNETGWSAISSMSNGDTSLFLIYQGVLAEDSDGNVKVDLAGSGQIGTRRIESSGVQEFRYDSSLGDYTHMHQAENFNVDTSYDLRANAILLGGNVTTVGFVADPSMGFFDSVQDGQSGLILANLSFSKDSLDELSDPPVPHFPVDPVPTPSFYPDAEFFSYTRPRVFKVTAGLHIEGMSTANSVVGTATLVPEPSSWIMFLAGLGLFACMLRKRN